MKEVWVEQHRKERISRIKRERKTGKRKGQFKGGSNSGAMPEVAGSLLHGLPQHWQGMKLVKVFLFYQGKDSIGANLGDNQNLSLWLIHINF